MSKESNIQDAKLDQAINQQNKQIKKIQENTERIIAANQILRESRDLQDKVTDFKKENQPTSILRKMLRVYPIVKHLFIKTTQEKIDDKIIKNRQMLKEIDETLIEMGGKSSSLQKVIKEELAIGAYELQEKLVKGIITSDTPKNVVTKLQQLEISPERWEQAVATVYNKNELLELGNQNQALNGIKSNINNLLNDNQNIPQLAPLQNELNIAQDILKKSLAENLKDTWKSIKIVFKDNNIQKIQKNALENTRKLDAIDKDLEKNLSNIEKSVKRRQKKLDKEFYNIASSKGYNSEQHKKISKLLEDTKLVEQLDTKLSSMIHQTSQIIPLEVQEISAVSNYDHHIYEEIKLEPIYENVPNTNIPLDSYPSQRESISNQAPDNSQLSEFARALREKQLNKVKLENINDRSAPDLNIKSQQEILKETGKSLLQVGVTQVESTGNNIQSSTNTPTDQSKRNSTLHK